MRIQKISYLNFRNYGKKGEVRFDDDGKISLVYGENGEGKTTFHQLFQWILYGKVNFNQTTSATKLYNLRIGQELPVERDLLVVGEIAFEHENVNYLAHREWGYYKSASGEIRRKTARDDFYIMKQLPSNDWRKVDREDDLIEQILPQGLSPYFFFDGETMIADLKMRGSESAKMLNAALTNLFDLAAYQNALIDIGKSNASTTVLGKLNAERNKVIRQTGNSDAAKYERDIKRLNSELERFEEDKEKTDKEIKKLEERISRLSEMIGSSRSSKRLEADRADWKKAAENAQKDIARIRLEFGREIEKNYAFLLIDAVVKDAENRMLLKVQKEEKDVIPGLTKALLKSLLEQDECVCGHHLDEAAKDRIREWMGYFPPASYKSTYDKFKQQAARHSGRFDEEELSEYLTRIFKKHNEIRNAEKKVDEIDEELKENSNIDEYVEERADKERKRDAELRRRDELAGKIKNNETQIRLREEKLKALDKSNGKAEKIAEQIALVERVRDMIIAEKQEKTVEYSRSLEKEIQNLVDTMMTTKRRVELSSDFQLRVLDSYDDESKSEGQFAAVSFAYISAILKVLKSHDRLKGKEYPLVLDGPFSKIDEKQRRNILNILPKYADQVIILSKEPLHDLLDSEDISNIYTIVSNDERNDAEIKEGYLWR